VHTSGRVSSVSKVNRLCLALLIVTGLCCVAGCVSPFTAHPDRMVPNDLPVQGSLCDSACISVGETESFQVLKEALTKEAFAKATDLTLTTTGVFKEIVGCSEEPNLRLSITFVHVGAEAEWIISFWYRFSVAVVVDWKLVGADEDNPLWHDKITTSARTTATTGLGAVEQACRENIRKAVLQLSTLARPTATAQTP